MAPHEPRILWCEGELTGGPVRLHWVSCRREDTAWARLAILHGYGDHAGRYAHFMRWMAERGVLCAAVDLRGHGRSQGKRAFVGRWDEYLEDVRVFLSSGEVTNPADGPLFVLGHSHGGLIAAVAAERGVLEPFGVRGVILCSPFLVSRLRRQKWNAMLARALNLVAPALPVGNGLKDEWMTHDPRLLAESRQDPLYLRTATARWYLGQTHARREALSNAGRFTLPLFAMAGSEDSIADPSGTERFVAAAGYREKQFQLFPGQLHELLRELERERTFAEVMEWVRRVSRTTS